MTTTASLTRAALPDAHARSLSLRLGTLAPDGWRPVLCENVIVGRIHSDAGPVTIGPLTPVAELTYHGVVEEIVCRDRAGAEYIIRDATPEWYGVSDRRPVCISRCEHCGYEETAHTPRPADECPRCARTTFTDRWIKVPHYRTVLTARAEDLRR